MHTQPDARPRTKDRILDAAEWLFAEYGLSETSLRQITARAGVNLAAVNYHFHSKDELVLATFARRIGPLNDIRIRALDDLERRAGDGPLQIEDVLRTFLEPVIASGPDTLPEQFRRLFGRMFGEPGDLFSRVIREQFDIIRQRYIAAFMRALPGVGPEEIVWKLFFMIGSMAHTLAGLHHLEAIGAGLVDTRDTNAIAERLIAFASAGFRAPSR
ncbi:MAG TPA: TetR/AcrR family transcriptional regulator [Bryobacteraceae bacterium]|nr:TetR/AcrR family transcriptional regulator [Bryobacteraceae bacterium]